MRKVAALFACLLLLPAAGLLAGQMTDAQIASIVVTANQVDVDAGALVASKTNNAEVKSFAELMVTLPETWALYRQSFKDESLHWPLRLLQELARLPHKHATWLGLGHTVPNGDPPEPYAASTKLCGAIILPSVTVPDEFHTLRIDETKEITFFSIVPLYADELAFNLREGANELLDKIDSAELSDVIDPLRRSVLDERFGIF